MASSELGLGWKEGKGNPEFICYFEECPAYFFCCL